MSYWLMGGECYYPQGGLRDLVSVHDTLDNAIAAAEGDKTLEWAEIIDVDEVMVVWYGENRAYGQ